jgi:hypothetical protein
VIGLGAIFAGLMLHQPPLQAAQLSRSEAKAVIQAVMQEDDFGQRETQTVWNYIGDATMDEEELPWLAEWLADVIQGFLQGLAGFGELLMWLALGGAIVYLIHWFMRNRSLLNPGDQGPGRRREPPQTVLGLDIRPETLPADIPAEALKLLEEGRQRTALSLLYRGCLSILVHHHQLEIPASATEGECLAMANRAIGRSRLAYLSRLTRAWLALAYGHRQVDPQQAEQLCLDWRRVYGK